MFRPNFPRLWCLARMRPMTMVLTQGIAQTTYHRWRERRAPGQVDTDRRCREPEREVDRLKRLVAELLLDKTMLQDIAKKKW